MMLAYIHADMNRITKRIPHIIAICLLAGLEIAVFVYLYFTDWSRAGFLEEASRLIDLLPIILGLPLYISAYAEDMRGRSLHVAIGRGMMRWQIVICKLLELAFLMLRYVVGFGVILWLLSIVLHTQITPQEMQDLCAQLSVEAVRMARDVCLATVFVALTHNINIGSVLYLLFASGVIEQLEGQSVQEMGAFTAVGLALIVIAFYVRELEQ